MRKEKSPRTRILTQEAALLDGGGGRLKLRFRVTASFPMRRLGASCVRVLRWDDTVVWTIWNTDRGSGCMTGHACDEHAGELAIAVPPGCYYAAVTFYARSETGSAAATVCTARITVT